MTRDEVSRTLRYMEHLRLSSYEAENTREERRMTREYGRLAKLIEPFVTGAEPYSEDRAVTSGERQP